MKIINVEVDKTFHNIPDTVLNRVVSEGVENLEMLKRLEDILISEKEYEAQGRDLDFYEDEQLAEIEYVAYNLNFKSINEYQAGMVAPTLAMSRRVNGSVTYLEQVQEQTHKFSVLMIPLTTEQIESMNKLVGLAIGELSYFIYYGFFLNRTRSSILENKELEMSLPFKIMLEETHKDINEVLTWILNLMETHKPYIPLFEAFPLLEEEFFDLAGAYIHDFETFSEYVTIDLVRDVIEGKIDVEDAVKDLEKQMLSDLED